MPGPKQPGGNPPRRRPKPSDIRTPPRNSSGLLMLLLLGGGAGAVLLCLVVLVVAVIFLGRKEPGLEAARDKLLGSAPAPTTAPVRETAPAAPPLDPDWVNDQPPTPDPKLPTARSDDRLEMDALGDGKSITEVRLPRDLQATFKRRMSRRIVVGDRVELVPPTGANLLGLLDLDESPALPLDAVGEFGDEVLRITNREVGLARVQEGRWVLPLGIEGDAPYQMVRKERSRVVTLRSLPPSPVTGLQMVKEKVVTLPEGAHDIDLEAKPNRLRYRLHEPKAPVRADKPSFTLTAKPHIMSALGKLYGDARFGKLWVSRSVFRNGGEKLTDFRVRFRLAGYSEWSGWQRCEVVYPGQTVVDLFRPVLDYAKLRELTGTTPAEVLAEYEYLRPNGTKVSDTHTQRTKLLGMNEGVFSDTALTPQSGWMEMFKDAPLVLATFVSANDPVILDVVGLLSKATAGAAPASSDRDATRFVEALYNLMRGNISYETTPGDVFDGMMHQHLKYGRDVLRTKSGTCVNTSILFASVAEAAGLSPVIIVIPGHAFAGVLLPESKQLLFVETTGCGGGTLETSMSFAQAQASAAKTLARAEADGRLYGVDVRQLRQKGVQPPELPRLGPTALKDWGVTMPAEAATVPGVAAGSGALDDASATAELLRIETGVVQDGVRGVNIHLHLRILNAAKRECEVTAIFLTEKYDVVQSPDPKYNDREGFLRVGTTVTPRFDKSDFADVRVFLPLAALPGGRGQHKFLLAGFVLCQGRILNEHPASGTITVQR